MIVLDKHFCQCYGPDGKAAYSIIAVTAEVNIKGVQIHCEVYLGQGYSIVKCYLALYLPYKKLIV